MGTITTKAFWAATAERAIKTFAQTELGTFIVGASITNIDWQAGLGIGGTAVVASILTSIVTDGITGTGPGLAEVTTAVKDVAVSTAVNSAVSKAVDFTTAEVQARLGVITPETLAAVQIDGKHEATEAIK